MKIVWICSFSNKKIQEKLPLWKNVTEFAPWITLSIEEFKKHPHIELHIISPHDYLKRSVSFQERNIYFHFFPIGIPFLHRHWPGFFKIDYWTKYKSNRKKIKNIINKIKPDLINLHGAERTIISTSIFDFKNYPILITIQGFQSLIPAENLTKNIKRIVEIEKKILTKFKHFGIRFNFMKDYIIQFNPNAIFHWFNYPIKKPSIIKSVEKKYDCIYFARLAKVKGVEDAIDAFRIVVKKKMNAKLAIVGKAASNEYLDFLKSKSKNNGIEKNIDFLGFMPTQAEVHKILAQSKISILPTYNDILPGTIIESMMARVPVIAYDVGAIPDVNSKEENIIIVQRNNIKDLANKILMLLENSDIRINYEEKGYKFATEYFDNARAIENMINSYKNIINKS